VIPNTGPSEKKALCPSPQAAAPATARGEALQISSTVIGFAPSMLGASVGSRMSGTSDSDSIAETMMNREKPEASGVLSKSCPAPSDP